MKGMDLTRTQLEAIESRFRAGTLRNEDIELLLSTCRVHLAGGKAPEAPPAPEPAGQTVAGGQIEVFSDGACQGNPGPGGWGAMVRNNGTAREMSGGEPRTTNNRMELTAVIEALKSLEGTCLVTVTTDSQYVKNGITSWIRNWKRNGWKTADRNPVKNQDLWMELDALNQKHQVAWRWIRGHSGHPENERCDELARKAIGGVRR